MRKTKTFWTHDEEEAFIRRTGTFLLAAHGSWTQCMLEANQELPEARRKSASTLAGSSCKYRARWDELRTQDIRKGNAEADALEEATRKEQERQASMHDRMPLSDWAAIAAPPADPLADLASALAHLVRSTVHDELQSLQAEFAKQLWHAVPATPIFPTEVPAPPWTVTSSATTKSRKPKVVLVGMIGQQISQIQHDYGDKFDIVAHQTTESDHLVGPRVAAADKVLVNTGKIGHSLYGVLRAKVDSSRLVQFDGGVSSVRRILEAME